MLSVECRLPLETIDFVHAELGLPIDYKESLIPKFPEFFSVNDVHGLELGISDSSLAVTAREERYMEERTLDTSRT